MFNNRQSRRRFRLGNLARLVQLRQSVSHQPSPPPSSFSDSGENGNSPQHVSTRSKSSPSSPKSMEETQPQLTPPPMSKPVETERNQLVRSPPPETGEVPPSPLTPEAKPPPPPPPSTLNSTEESPSQLSPPLPTSESIDDARLRSPSQKSPPSLTDPGESRPPLSPLQAKKTPLSSPLTLDANERSPMLLPSKTIDETQAPPLQASSQSLSEDSGSQLPKPLSEAEIPTKVNTTEDSQSQPLPAVPPFRSINENRFRSPPPSPQSLPEYVESQPPLPPPQTNKTLPSSPSTLNAKEESPHQQSPPLVLSKSIDETRVRSSPPSLTKSGELQAPLPPLEAKIPPSLLNATKYSQSQQPPLSKSIDETLFQASPPSLPESGESKPPLSPTEAKLPPSTQNSTKESDTQPIDLPSKSIDETRSRSSPPLDASPPSLPESGESQPPLQAPIPTSLPLTLNPNEESQSEPLPPSKTIDETRFLSSPPSFPESGDSQLPLPPPPAEIPTSLPSTLNSNEESQSKPPSPSKTIDEARFHPPSASLSESGESTPPLPSTTAKVPPSTLNSTEESEPQPLLPSKSIDETLSQSSKSIEPKPTLLLPESRSQTHSLPPQSKLLSPKASENLQSQPHMPSPITITAPPPLPSPPESHRVIPPTKPSLSNPSQSPSPKLKNTEPHNKGEKHNPEKSDEKLVKIPANKTEIKRGKKAKWSEKTNSIPVMMFINSNVQGINTSLSLDSSSIDHHPGVHLTIDYDQISDL